MTEKERFTSVYVMPNDCPIKDLNMLRAFCQKDQNRESSAIMLEALMLIRQNLNWKKAKPHWLPGGNNPIYEWVCAGCTSECKTRRVKLGGTPL